MGINFGGLVRAGTGVAAGAEDVKRQRDIQNAELLDRFANMMSEAKLRNAQEDYFEGRNPTQENVANTRTGATLGAADTRAGASEYGADTRAGASRYGVDARQSAQRAADAGQSADLEERTRHDRALEQAANDRNTAIREFHKQQFRGDAADVQARNFAKSYYIELSKPSKDPVTGEAIPAPPPDEIMAKVRTATQALYGPIADRVLPAGPQQAPQQAGAPSPRAVAGYQADLARAMTLHQRAISLGHPVPAADAALAQVDANLHAKYNLGPRGSAPGVQQGAAPAMPRGPAMPTQQGGIVGQSTPIVQPGRPPVAPTAPATVTAPTAMSGPTPLSSRSALLQNCALQQAPGGQPSVPGTNQGTLLPKPSFGPTPEEEEDDELPGGTP